MFWRSLISWVKCFQQSALEGVIFPCLAVLNLAHSVNFWPNVTFFSRTARTCTSWSTRRTAPSPRPPESFWTSDSSSTTRATTRTSGRRGARSGWRTRPESEISWVLSYSWNFRANLFGATSLRHFFAIFSLFLEVPLPWMKKLKIPLASSHWLPYKNTLG